eukprot:TRINITY_DN1721_c0_g1_i2.p1 TRINITY_DN1721_c0_g1~~TRINITY_DN1721_c0_g1_i2.p1  ORF type:complete len:438 (+),score=58.94 TRINITY_DN1721_c0_g1_i2:322-1635(+)
MYCLLAIVITITQAQILADKITQLPYYSGSKLGNQYSGYIEVDKSHGRRLHYWFAESQSNPDTDPLVLWLNGGPGCSSLDGFLYENGPFKFAETTQVKLVDNPWAWNKGANVLYLESPAGVGFSYSDDTDDYNTGDNRTANDNYHFLQLWLTSYPKFRSNDFYITGESYAGVYIPWLAQRVVNGNLKGTFKIPLKGIMVGNGVSNADGTGDLTVNIPFLYGHGIVSRNLHKLLVKACNIDPNGDDCQNYIGQAEQLAEGLNIYGIYYDCASQRPEMDPRRKLRTLDAPPCTTAHHADLFLNDPAVKKAIHVDNSLTWTICNDDINFNYDRTPDSTVPIHQFLLQNGIRVLIYSGDTDYAVPYTDSEYWTTHAGLTESSAWHQWTYKDLAGDQVAGMATVYSEGLTFVTVKGSGHMVPQFRPQQASVMFNNFLSGKPF